MRSKSSPEARLLAAALYEIRLILGPRPQDVDQGVRDASMLAYRLHNHALQVLEGEPPTASEIMSILRPDERERLELHLASGDHLRALRAGLETRSEDQSSLLTTPPGPARTSGERSILQQMVDASATHFPSVVLGAAWAAETLTLWGDGWSFSTMSSWRLLKQDALACSCFDAPGSVVDLLIGRRLDRVQVRTGAAISDPSLVFNDCVLEVLSDIRVEPWVMSLPEMTYVPSEVSD